MTSGDAMDIGDLRASAASALTFLKKTRYPATKQHIIKRASTAGAPTGVMEVFHRISDREYANSMDLMKEINEVTLITAYKRNITGKDLPGSA